MAQEGSTDAINKTMLHVTIFTHHGFTKTIITTNYCSTMTVITNKIMTAITIIFIIIVLISPRIFAWIIFFCTIVVNVCI
jgi:hypothetical protein